LNRFPRSFRAIASLMVSLFFLAGCAGTRNWIDDDPVGRAGPSFPPSPDSQGGSIGAPNNGALSDGKQLKSFPGARVASPDRCWGAPEAVDLLVAAVNETRQAFPGAPDMLIGDFSTQFGGFLGPHKSHQSGRDVDVSIFTLKGGSRNGFNYVAPDNMDLERTWYFIETLLMTERVQMILVDYELQAPLYEFVQAGYSGERLAAWFQYPNGQSYRKAIIRHAPRHHDHLHIRFKCPEADRHCID
jgi:hypothetical protein